MVLHKVCPDSDYNTLPGYYCIPENENSLKFLLTYFFWTVYNCTLYCVLYSVYCVSSKVWYMWGNYARPNPGNTYIQYTIQFCQLTVRYIAKMRVLVKLELYLLWDGMHIIIKERYLNCAFLEKYKHLNQGELCGL